MNLKKLSLVTFAAIAMFATTSAAAFADSAMATTDVKVRDDNSMSADWIDTLYLGEIVDVVDCWGKWCYVEHKGPDGWVRKKYLDFKYYMYTDFNHDSDADISLGLGFYSDHSSLSFGFEISN